MAKNNKQALLCLAWVFFVVFQCNVELTLQDKSVNFKLRPLQSSSRKATKLNVPAWDDMGKAHKMPSGPNPVGNHRPPTRP